MAPTDLHDLAVEWLAVCEEAVATTPGGAIDRAFVSPGPPAFDCCPQLTVHCGAPLQEGDTASLTPPLQPGHRSGQGSAVDLVNLTATVIRCMDTEAEMPDKAVLQEVARVVNADVWAVWHHTRWRHREQTLFPSPSGSRELMLDPAVPIPAQGGCVGWQIQIRVALGGYHPA